jgi:hypothetical protein
VHSSAVQIRATAAPCENTRIGPPVAFSASGFLRHGELALAAGAAMFAARALPPRLPSSIAADLSCSRSSPVISAGCFSPRGPLGKTDSLLPKLVAGLLYELLETRRRQ